MHRELITLAVCNNGSALNEAKSHERPSNFPPPAGRRCRIRIELEDPELFSRRAGSGLVILDEVHRLTNPSELLKIAADHFPKLAVIATGSSTLAARTKFRDTLTGRKSEVWLTPMIWRDVVDFGMADESIDRRMIHGGLPAFYLGDAPDDAAFAEWMDSYWAKDLQELFVVDKKASFYKLVELLFRQSGGMFEAQTLTGPCELSRQTVQHYLEILGTTLLATVLRPYSGGGTTELVHQPRVYMFDTGFVAYFRGWDSAMFYWRDKQKHEVDFILKPKRGTAVTAIECKATASGFDPAGMAAFRRHHPAGTNLLVCLDASRRSARKIGGLEVDVVPYTALGDLLDAI